MTTIVMHENGHLHTVHALYLCFLFSSSFSFRSIEYWFRVLDKDGDGFLSLYELEYFYEDILLRLDEMNIESLSVRDTICHVLDMINPKHQCKPLWGWCTYWCYFLHVLAATFSCSLKLNIEWMLYTLVTERGRERESVCVSVLLFIYYAFLKVNF